MYTNVCRLLKGIETGDSRINILSAFGSFKSLQLLPQVMYLFNIMKNGSMVQEAKSRQAIF